jgi:hypothetical protein
VLRPPIRIYRRLLVVISEDVREPSVAFGLRVEPHQCRIGDHQHDHIAGLRVIDRRDQAHQHERVFERGYNFSAAGGAEWVVVVALWFGQETILPTST